MTARCPRCSAEVGVRKDPELAPVLVLRPHGHTGPPLRCVLGLKICAEHAKTTTVADYVSDEGWATIVGSIHLAGRMLPARELTVLEWTRLDSLEVRMLRSSSLQDRERGRG